MSLKSNQILSQPNFAPAEFNRTIWHAKIPHYNTLEDIMLPEFWSNIAGQMRVGDRIECYAEDGTYFVELMVTAVAERTPTKPANWVKVFLMRNVPLIEKTKLAVPEGFTVKFRGPTAKWCVLREPDGDVVVEKQASQTDAIREFFKIKDKMVAVTTAAA